MIMISAVSVVDSVAVHYEDSFYVATSPPSPKALSTLTANGRHSKPLCLNASRFTV